MATVQPAMTFGEVLEAVDRLTIEEQEDVAAIVRRRLSEHRRKQIVQDVEEARQEFSSGGCRHATADELMGEILS